MCEWGEWKAAAKTQRHISCWLVVDVFPLLKAGHPDPTLDKAFQESKGSRSIFPLCMPLDDEEMSTLLESTCPGY